VVGSDFCWANKVLPYTQIDNYVYVACVDPFAHDTKNMLEFFLQKPIEMVIVREDQLRKMLCQYAPSEQGGKDSDTSAGHGIEVNSTKKPTDAELSNTAPIVKLCNKIVVEALNLKASDIHLEPNENGLDVRLRVLGSMTNVFTISKKMQPYVLTRLKILAGMDISERRKPQDGRIKSKINGKQADIRVSTIPTAFGEKMVMRLLVATNYTKDLKSLGMPSNISEQVEAALKQEGRMFLVTGPTGSGKTTTLYSCLQSLQDGSLNISTVEDPIEYRMKGTNQVQVNQIAGVTFASALRSLLRQDPDVIMVGEIRDEETAVTAAQAAQTGHLVLSTLHTNDAVSTVKRLEQLGCPPYLTASCLTGILAQRLVRTICPECIQEVSQEEYTDIVKKLTSHGITNIPNKISVGKGCSSCHGAGYGGRTGIYSYLHVNSEIEELIANSASSQELVRAAQKSGFMSLAQSAYQLLHEQKTTFEEVYPIILSDVSSIQVAKFNNNVSENSRNNNNYNTINKKKLLLVEDDENLRQILSMLLKKEMYDVDEATNGQEALEKIYSNPPELILCDLMMPVMGGRELLAKIKKNSATSKIPVVILTAADDEDNEIDLLELGAEDFVSKGSSSNIMLSRLRKISY
jgi:type IV pilus assembly protein PilB